MVLPVAGAEVLLLADGFAGMAAGAAALPAAVAGAVGGRLCLGIGGGGSASKPTR